MNNFTETEEAIYAIIGMLLVVAMFAFVVYTSYGVPETVYGGSIGENMSKYSCMENPDMCVVNVSNLSRDFGGVE